MSPTAPKSKAGIRMSGLKGASWHQIARNARAALAEQARSGGCEARHSAHLGNAGKRLPAVFAVLLMLGACSGRLSDQNSVSTPPTAADPPRADERVVVLVETGDDEQVGMDCVRRAVAHRGAIPAAEFRAALYPRFEPGNLPKSEADLADLLDGASVRETIASMGVRYIVVVRGETRAEEERPLFFEYSFVWTNSKSSSLSFRVWDLASVKSLGGAYATAAGMVGGGFIMLIPVVKWASTEAAACEEISRRLGEIFEPGREAAAIKSGGGAVVLLRFVGQDQNGDRLELFGHVGWPGEYLQIAIGEFGSGGVLEWREVRTLGSAARDEGWLTLVLPPGYHDLVFGMSHILSQAESLPPWRIEVPPGVPVIYAGTLHLSGLTKHIWLQGMRIVNIDQAATTVEDETEAAVQTARRDLSALPPPVTRLAVGHTGPLLPRVPQDRPSQ